MLLKLFRFTTYSSTCVCCVWLCRACLLAVALCWLAFVCVCSVSCSLEVREGANWIGSVPRGNVMLHGDTKQRASDWGGFAYECVHVCVRTCVCLSI